MRRVLCLITLLLALGRLAVASAYRALLLLPASAAANLTQRPPTLLLLVTDTASFSTCHSAPLFRSTTTTLRPVLRRAALPLCPVLSCPELARCPPTPCPPDRPAPPYPASGVWRAGTRGPLTFTCSRSLTPVPFLLLHSTPGLLGYFPLRLDYSTPTLRLGPFLHYTQHTCRALPSRQQKLTTIFLLRQHLCQQRPRSYYGLGRNRRGKLFLRPEPDSRPLPTNLLRPSADTIAQSLHKPQPAEATPDSVPACRVHVTEDAHRLCGS